MRQHVIIGRYGPDDRDPLALNYNENETRLDLVASTRLGLVPNERALDHGIGKALSDLVQLGVYPSEMGLDMLVFAAHVHAADTRISRSAESQDGWTRELRLVVPVADPRRWTLAGPVFKKMLDFLTGDRWSLTFRARPDRFATLVPATPPRLIGPRFDNLALFSGGLDSLVSAIDSIESGHTPLFISHAGDNATSNAQTRIFDTLKRQYQNRSFNRLRLWMAFSKKTIPASAGENTTRGRSFLFFALGVFAGTGLETPFVLNVPENGLIAINVPLDPLRLGALSTRTTHPYYISRWNDILTILGINGRIINPYWDKTKGEMVQSCANLAVLQGLTRESLSCAAPSKVRWLGVGLSTQHCGYCLPCLIRQAALRFGLAPNSDPTGYTVDITSQTLNSRRSQGRQIRSFQLAIARLRARPALASVLIHKPGPLVDVSFEDQMILAGVYRRGLEEVASLLTDVRTQPQ